MTHNFDPLIEQYVRWLKDKTLVKKLRNDWVEITTPFLDRHNDYIQIYARHESGKYTLTDDGSTIEDLKFSGCEIRTKKRTQLLNLTLNGFGVALTGEALTVTATPSDFAQKKHDLIQAILAVNDMFYLAESTVANVFFEDVSNWFDERNIRYTPRVRFAGRTGFAHNFDFVIPKSSAQPERVIQLMNKPTRSYAEKVAFTWVDTKDSRLPNTRAYAFLNDRADGNVDEVALALRNYDIQPLRWSKRDELAEVLSA